MLKATDEEIEEVREYFEWQAPDLEVTFISRIPTRHGTRSSGPRSEFPSDSVGASCRSKLRTSLGA